MGRRSIQALARHGDFQPPEDPGPGPVRRPGPVTRDRDARSFFQRHAPGVLEVRRSLAVILIAARRGAIYFYFSPASIFSTA